MTDVAEIVKHWHETPPLADCVRGYLGIKPPAAGEWPARGSPENPIEISFEQFERMKLTLQERRSDGR